MLGQEDIANEAGETQRIPDKLFFRIGEVSDLVGVEAYVLRYWESEFPALSPKKSSTGQRMFRRKDVEMLLRIKHLLYDRKYTIDGARQALIEKTRAARRKPVAAAPVKQEGLFAAPVPTGLHAIRQEVADLVKLLS